MTHTKRIIQDAIEGGYEVPRVVTKVAVDNILFEVGAEPFMQPTFWWAVGKTRGWGTNGHPETGIDPVEDWTENWHRFIDHLAEGLTIEEALAKLT